MSLRPAEVLTWTAVLAVAAAPAAGAQTLRAVLGESGIEIRADGPTELDRPITSHAVQNAGDLFVVAYYWLGEVNLLPDTIRISALDKASAAWSHAALPRRRPDAADLGSIVGIRHTRAHVYLESHITPSAATTVLLTRRLEPVGAFDGWTLLLLPDDLAVYQRSQPHFAPTHPAEVWVHQAGTGRDGPLYPTAPHQSIRRAYVAAVRRAYAALGEDWFRVHNHHMDPERFDGEVSSAVVANAAGTAVAFVTRFGNPGDVPGAPAALDVVVVCRDIRSATPRCTEAELDAHRRERPGRSTEQMLDDAVRR